MLDHKIWSKTRGRNSRFTHICQRLNRTRRPVANRNSNHLVKEFVRLWKKSAPQGNLQNDSHIFRVFEANGNYTDFIDSITIKKNPEFGRHVVATKSLNVGQIVTISKPFASVVNNTAGSYCLSCHEINKAFIPCDRCTFVRFCSMECKMSNNAHTFECGSNYHSVNYVDIAIKLAIQIILEALGIFKGNATNLKNFVINLLSRTNKFKTQKRPTVIRDAESRLECVMSLESALHTHIDEQNVRIAYNRIMDLPEVRTRFSAEEDQLFLIHFLAHNLGVIAMNSFDGRLTGDNNSPYTGYIYDACSLFNHSCSPNVIKFQRGNTMVGITGRRINKKEQLCISYTNVEEMNREDRRAMLYKIWKFRCECERCLSKTEISDVLKQVAGKYDDLIRLENELSKRREWTTWRGAQMLLYKQRLDKLIANRNFLKI